MNFKQLPIELQYKIAELPSDPKFQQKFSNDQTMIQLEQLKYDPVIEYNQVQLAFHNKLRIRCAQYKEETNKSFFQRIVDKWNKLLKKEQSPYIYLEPITLGMWSFLYTIKSPIVFNDLQLTSIDIDLFYYLLQQKRYDLPVEQLFTRSINYCQDKLHIEQQLAVQIMQKLVRVSFRVLNMFPRLKLQAKPAFNLDWLTSIVTKASQVSSYSTQQIYKDVPLCQAYYLFAQYCRENGREAIYLRKEEDIIIEQDLRASQIIVQYLIEKGYIDETNKTYYVNLIHNITGG